MSRIVLFPARTGNVLRFKRLVPARDPTDAFVSPSRFQGVAPFVCVLDQLTNKAINKLALGVC